MRGSSPAAATEPRSQQSLLHALGLLLDNVPGLVSDRVHLLALELKRAGVALGQMVALFVLAAICALTAWFALWSAVAAGLVAAGLDWGWAAVLVVVVNLLLAWLALRRASSMTPLLKLPATMRSLTFTEINPLGERSDER